MRSPTSTLSSISWRWDVGAGDCNSGKTPTELDTKPTQHALNRCLETMNVRCAWVTKTTFCRARHEQVFTVSTGAHGCDVTAVEKSRGRGRGSGGRPQHMTSTCEQDAIPPTTPALTPDAFAAWRPWTASFSWSTARCRALSGGGSARSQ